MLTETDRTIHGIRMGGEAPSKCPYHHGQLSVPAVGQQGCPVQHAKEELYKTLKVDFLVGVGEVFRKLTQDDKLCRSREDKTLVETPMEEWKKMTLDDALIAVHHQALATFRNAFDQYASSRPIAELETLATLMSKYHKIEYSVESGLNQLAEVSGETISLSLNLFRAIKANAKTDLTLTELGQAHKLALTTALKMTQIRLTEVRTLRHKGLGVEMRPEKSNLLTFYSNESLKQIFCLDSESRLQVSERAAAIDYSTPGHKSETEMIGCPGLAQVPSTWNLLNRISMKLNLSNS